MSESISLRTGSEIRIWMEENGFDVVAADNEAVPGLDTAVASRIQ